MTVVATVSCKGGCSKSVLARALAVEAARAGVDVLLVDLDRLQLTASAWGHRREAGGHSPVVSVVQAPDVDAAIRVGVGRDLLILDTAGRADEDTVAVARRADLIICPSGTCFDDTDPTIQVLNSLRARGIPAERVVVVLVQVASDALEKIARDRITAAGYRVLPGSVAMAAGYQHALNKGLAITEATHSGLRAAARDVINTIIDALPDGSAAEVGADSGAAATVV